MIQTKYGELDGGLDYYFRRLTDRVFKLLPLREEANPGLVTYIASLQMELVGLNSLLVCDGYHELISLIASLESLKTIEEFTIYRREVFRCISLCEKLRL